MGAAALSWAGSAVVRGWVSKTPTKRQEQETGMKGDGHGGSKLGSVSVWDDCGLDCASVSRGMESEAGSGSSMLSR